MLRQSLVPIAVLVLSSALLAQQTYVVPPTFATTTGSASAYPWNSTSARAMNIYGGQLFPTQPLTITQISWRPSSGTATVGPVTFTVDLTFSTSSTPVTSLNATFDSNHGPDKTLVFSGSVSVNVPSVQPYDFTHDIVLQTPFTYDPSQGNFLVDIQMHGYSGGPRCTCDGAFTTGLGVGRIAHTSSSTATTANFYSSGTSQDYAYVIELIASTCNGSVALAGTGCMDSGGTQNTLGFSGCPDLGTALNVEFHTSASAVGPLFLVFGQSDQNWSGIVLPLDLGLLGAQGCSNYVSHDFLIGGFVPVSGLGSVGLQIPSTPWIVGAATFIQGYHIDPGANPLGLATTNYMQVVIG